MAYQTKKAKAHKELSQKDQAAILELGKDPVLFVKAVFGVTPTSQQEQLLRAATEHGAKISVASGHGTGKTAALAWLIIWFLLFHEDVKIPCTAPTAGQLHDVLWAEIAKWHSKILFPAFKDSIVITSDRVHIKGAEKHRYAVARTSAKDKPEALQGFHATNLMVIVDEASGVDNKVFEVAEGTLSTESAKIILISNPTRNSGYFYDTQLNQNVKKNWTRFRFSCLDSSNVSDKFCKDMLQKYGEASNVYRVRVLGQFPELGDDAIHSRSVIESAIDRDVSYSSSPKIAGLDPARYGDDATALVIRQGGKIIHIDQWRGKGLDETMGIVVALHKEGRFDRIYIDSIGIGCGLVDFLPHKGVPVIGVNVSERTSQNEKYVRLRDELWFNGKEFFEDLTCCIDSNCKYVEELIDELCAPTFRFMPNGKIKVESKDEMKARGIPSPNLADALNNTLYNYQSPSKQLYSYMPYDDYNKNDSVQIIL